MHRGALAVILVGLALTSAAGSTAVTPTGPTGDSIRLAGLPDTRRPSRSTVDWCGTGQPTAVDRKPELDPSSTRQVHVTYAIPADAPDQFTARANPIVTDIAAIDAWWRGQDGTRALRFDLYPFAGCATKFGKLDLGFIRLPRTSSLYQGEAGADRLISDLSQLAALPTQKHLVYYDGPNVFDQFVCGTAFVTRSSPTQGGLNGISFVWLRSLCGGDLGTGRIAATVAVHEAIHGLGSLLQGSPNECDPPDDGHVCDSTTDILYPEANSQTSLATQTLDVNRDDYYGHSLATFDVQDSEWLSRLPQVPLTVSMTGKGTVRLTAPSQFDCTSNCTLELDKGVGVSLVAVPAQGARFLGWRGACTGTGACNVTMDAATGVTAQFGANTFRLAVSVAGKGKVVSTPAGIACPGRCSATYTGGTTVRLRTVPAKGYRFAGWTGACRGTAACLVGIDQNRATRAVFRKK